MNKIHEFNKKLFQKSIYPHLDGYLKGDMDKAPISIHLDLIAACNYKCKHCIDRWYYNGKQLDFDYLIELVSYWQKKGLKAVIVMGGGEPTLYPQFEAIIRFLKFHGLQVGIVSNGSNMKKIADIVECLNKKDWVRLSLDAGSTGTFQRLHNTNISFCDILREVKEMRKEYSNFQMGYSFLVMEDNIDEIESAARLAKEYGFSYFSVKPYIDIEKPRETIMKNLKDIKEQIESAKLLDFPVVESTNLMCFYDKELKKALQSPSKTCHAQYFRLVVTPVGIFLCSLWRGFKETKIIDTNKPVTEEYLKQLQENRIKMIKKFNPQKICKKSICIYSSLNNWIDNLPKPIDDFGDYFL